MPRREKEAAADSEQQELDARETLAADEVPEFDASTEDADLDLALEAHATEDIVGDVDGDDYRAGTLDPEGSDRGPRGALTHERLDDSDRQRR